MPQWIRPERWPLSLGLLAFLLMALLRPCAQAADSDTPVPNHNPAPVADAAADFVDDADEYAHVVVAEPYLEMHTGPGRGFPKFQAVERGAKLTVLKRRTAWFLVRNARGKEGWVALESMRLTLTASGEPFTVKEYSRNDSVKREWEVGFLFGETGGANTVTTYGDWSFTENLVVEAGYQQVLGNFSDSRLYNLRLLSMPFPDWRIAPFFALGMGRITTDASGSLVRTEDRKDNTVHVGAGLRTYLTRSFVIRMDYNDYVVLTSRNENEHLQEWKIGFSLFF